MAGKAIGVDIGGTHFRIGKVDLDGTVSDFRKIPVRQVFCTSDPMKDLTAYLKSYCMGTNAEVIAIGFPATLDAKRQRVLQAPNIAYMENMPVVEVLERELQIPVFIERDVTMVLHYDCKHYGIPPKGIACGFYFGTGIGNAISINGVPLVGKNGTAGELGHIPVDGSEEICGCGNIGCMESLAGGKYLAGLCQTVYAGTPIGELFVRYGNEAIMRQFVDRMAMAVATEINLLDPEHILIGGGVPAMEAFPKEDLFDRIRFHTRKPLPADTMEIIFVDDVEEKSVIGAALYGMEMKN